MRFNLLHQAFEARVRNDPSAVAVSFEGSQVTYSELDAWANRIARALRARGISRGSLVGVLLPRSPGAYASILGIMKSGGAYIPIDSDYPTDRVRFILEDSSAAALVTDSELEALAGPFEGETLRLDSDEINSESPTPLPPDPTGAGPEDLCYVIYTSGSTGRPKGVQVMHRNAMHLVEAEAEIFRPTPKDRVCQAASLAFDLSLEETWLAFNSGAVLVPVPPSTPNIGPDFFDFLKRNRVSILSTVPTLLSTIDDALPDLRLVILGGETCPDWVLDRWVNPGRRVVNTYGPTETTVIATYCDLVPGKKVTIGHPVPGYSVYLLDEALNPVPEGSEGEICIGGPGVAKGYVGLPDETNAKFVSDPYSPGPGRLYRTGDLGRLDTDGELLFLGRGDSQVKLRGFRVELSEVETVLAQQEGVQAAACSVRVDRGGVQQLIGYVVPKEGFGVDERGIRGRLRGSLPAYMVPSMIEAITELPTLPSGKLNRSALPAPRPRVPSRPRQSSAQTHAQLVLTDLWSSLFSPQPVSMDDDFFLDLGGHSLLAARMVSQLRREPAFSHVSVADVYECPTIRALAAKCETNQSLSRESDASLATAATQPRQGRPRRHLASTVLQAFGLYFSFGLRAFEWMTPYLVFFFLDLTGHPLLFCLALAMASAVLVFPLMFIFALGAKWALLGRIRPGRHPLWGKYYLRWWLAQSLVSAVPLDYLTGTPLLPTAYRLLGASIGDDVQIETDNLRAFDLISIGDHSSIDEDASLLGYSVEQGELVIGPVAVGNGCFVGTRSVLSEWTTVEDGGRLEDLSLLPRGGVIPRGETWAGSPARQSSIPPRLLAPPPQSRFRKAANPLLYALLASCIPILTLAVIFPGVLVLFSINVMAQPILYLLAIPAVGAFFVATVMSEFVLLKWALVGRVKPGTYPVHSGFYVRNWVVDQLHSLTLDLAAPLHATVYIAPWYRALGSKVGRSVEISTATSTTPDLLELGDESTVADEVSLGSPRTEGGWMTVSPTVLGRRSFAGNSAVIPAGTTMGDGTLCGVLTLPPSGPASSNPGAAWLGSPPIELPHRERSGQFSERRTFHPTKRMKLVRGAIESLRVTLPPAGFIVVTTVVLGSTMLLWRSLGILPALLLLPAVYGLVCGATAVAAAGAKWGLIGRYKPFEKPLWTTFIWRLELVNAFYEFLVTPLFLEPLQGTPFLPAYERLLGSKVGRGVYVHTTGFLEWDLVEVGDGASLNEDCVLQTHLFEDRVLKSSYLRIGEGCDVGAYSVVLYESEMEEGSRLDALSLLMKGERLPKDTAWRGIPARRGAEEIEVVESVA